VRTTHLSADEVEVGADAISVYKNNQGGAIVIPHSEIVRLDYGDVAPDPYK